MTAMKKRSIYLILLAAVTIAAICFGTYVHAGRPVFNFSKGNFSVMFGSEGTHETHKKITEFSSVDIDLKNADVSFKTGDGYSLTYMGLEKNFPSCKVENDVLSVRDPAGKKPKGILQVTLPQSFKDITVNTDNGDIIFDTDQEITVDTIDLESDNGDIIVKSGKNLTVTTAKTDCENGDTVIVGWQGSSLTASSKNGDIGATQVGFDEIDAKSDNGDIGITTSDKLSSYTFHLTGGNGDISIGDGIYSGTLSKNSEITVGEGQKSMRLVSKNGDVKVRGSK